MCEHRDPYIRNMVAFRKYVAGTDVVNWWDNGANAIAFARGNRGFVAINRENTPLNVSVQTGLPAGSYTEIINAGTVTVDNAGMIQLQLPAMTAIAFTTAR